MLRIHVAAAALALLAAAPALAQSPRPVELGMDALLAVTLDDPRITTLTLPVGVVRAGFFASDRVSIEPALNLDYTGVEDQGSSTALALDVGLLLHFSPDRTRRQGYLRPYVGVTHISVDYDASGQVGDASFTQYGAGAGLGMKLPVRDRLAVRLEGTFDHTFSADDVDARSALGVTFGLSFFTR